MMKRELKEVVEDARQKGVDKIITIGVDIESCKKNISIAERFDNIYTAIGFHPHDSKKMKEEEILLLEEMVAHPKNVAIGEIGLDFYYNHSNPDIQKEAFRRQIDLANKYNLPIIIHDRDAHKDTIKVLAEKALGRRVVLHCFSGDINMAKWCVEEGYYLGIGGIVTFKNAHTLSKVVQEIPLKSILLETDAPFLTPHPYRGKSNEPKYIPIIAEKIAQLKGKTVSEIAQITTENAHQVFGLS
jgi:TatD DNase family protein